MDNSGKIPFSVGITAYNEAANIGGLLQRFLDSKLESVEMTELIVVASGCTDGTEDIVRKFEAVDPRIKLLVQENREGKASAINLILRNSKERVFLLCSADLMPAFDCVEKLVAPFADEEIGMASAHPVPVNDPETFMGFAAHLLWGLHHQINLSSFKAGEMIAMRKIFERIPYNTAVDEASIEPVIRGQGYKVTYIGDAIVNNKGPETVDDFMRQRRRIYAGHLAVKDLLGYSVSTMSGLKIAGLLVKNLDWRPQKLWWTFRIVLLEMYGRYLGSRDHKSRHEHAIWEIATTTKELAP